MTSQVRLGFNAIFRHEALKYGKNDDVIEKGNVLRIPKIYRNLSLLFSSFKYFNFSKDV